ncbi:MAG: hypothetical protein VST71_04655 [Nitrospirota bacterium]|nr:hypothetical protein [Nitrospirota bacterium]
MQKNNSDKNLICVRCGQPVEKNKDNYETFEKMHWICFHFEYEHEVDPDEPCSHPSCPWWHLEIYKKKLKELGVNPEQVVEKAIEEQWK